MFSRKGTYETRDEAGEQLEFLQQKFSVDLKKHIKRINNYPLFSKEWNATLELIEHICKIAVMENSTQQNKNSATSATSSTPTSAETTNTTAPTTNTSTTTTSTPPLTSPSSTPFVLGAKRPGSSAGRIVQPGSSSLSGAPKKPIITNNNNSAKPSTTTGAQPSSSSTSTLWDRDELSLRFLIEEGKMNLLVRLLKECKQKQLNLIKGTETYEDVATKSQLTVEDVKQKMTRFENNLAKLILLCLETVEAVQMLDYYEFVQLIRLTFDAWQAAMMKLSLVETCVTECLSFSYMKQILKRGQHAEENFVKIYQEQDILSSQLDFLNATAKKLDNDMLVTISESLSDLMGTESFKTKLTVFFPTEENKKRLVNLHDLFVKELLTTYERKKALRNLTDCITRFKL